jgi:penicillin-binding protein 2
MRAVVRDPPPPTWPGQEVMSVVDGPWFGSAGFYARVGVLGMVTLAAFSLLGLRLWSLQVLQSARFKAAATSQASRTVLLPAGRGAIVDDRGRPLVETGGELVVQADPAVLGLPGAGGAWQPTRRGREILTSLSRLASVPTTTLIARVRRSLASNPFAPVVVVPQASAALATYLAERARRYPGLTTAALPTRVYPLGPFGGEFLGLLGQLSRPELVHRDYPWARAGEAVGQSGLESSYDRYLNGGFNVYQVGVDALGRPQGRLGAVGEPRPPSTLELTIDAHIQQVAETAIRNGIRLARHAGYTDANAGAAVVMDPRTGALFALASYPQLDQSAAANDAGYLQGLLSRPGGGSPLVDLATQGLFPTGSAFKPVVAEAALAAGLITPSSTLPCTGSLTVGGIVFHNIESWIDAALTLPQALEISCDTWFYRLGEDFYLRQLRGSLDIQRWARLLGLGHPTGLDIPGESGGVVPTPGWLQASYGATWYEGQSVNLSIGQGYLDVTPLQLAVAYAALANGGTVVRPHLAGALLMPERREPLSFPPVRHVPLVDVNAISQGLYLAAHAPGGTSAGVFASFPLPVAGKTGTAQVPSGSDDSWYASWAPAWNPRVVVVVLIEHGGFGADAAAPAARQIYQALFPRRASGRRATASPAPMP